MYDIYKNIKLFIIVAGISFGLMICASIFGGILPARYATRFIIGIFLVFVIFGFSLVPLFIRLFLRANIRMWEKVPPSGHGFTERTRIYIIQNEVRIFNILLFLFWGIFLLGLVIALPVMIRDGFFRPENFQPGESALMLNVGSVSASPRDDIVITEEYHETIYSIKDVPIRLSVYHGGNEGVVHFESKSDQPIGLEIEVMERLITRAIKDQKRAPDTLFMGTVEESFGRNRDVSARLSDAAKASPLWNIKKGCASDGNDNRAVKTFLNDANAYRELTDMFKRHGMIIKVRSVEKVRIDDKKLPFDCMV